MEDYLQAVRDHYLDLASDQSIKTDLRAVLADQTPHRLKGVWHAVMGEDECCESQQEQLFQMLTQPLFLADLLLFLPDDSLRALTCLREKSRSFSEISELSGVPELVTFGLVYVYRSGFTFLVPNEIQEALSGVCVDAKRRTHWQQVVQGMSGAIHFYGAIEADALMNQISRLPAAADLKVKDIRTIRSLLLRSSIYWQQGSWLTSTAYCSDEKSLRALMEQQQAYPYREIPVAELLRFADDSYFPQTAELRDLHEQLLRIGITTEQADAAVRLVGIGLRRDPPKAVFAVLMQEMPVDLNQEEQLLLVRLIHAAASVSHSIRYRGHTAREEMELQRSWRVEAFSAADGKGTVTTV